MTYLARRTKNKLEVLAKGLSRKKKVLIIEDDEDMRSLLEAIVMDVYPHVTIEDSASAEEALCLLQNDPLHGQYSSNYDLIIVDIFLQGESTGLDFWKYIQEKFPMTTVLITSALSASRFFTAVGADTISPPYLEKPFQIGEAKQKIEGLLCYN